MADAEAGSPLTAEDKERLRVAIIRTVAGLDGYENPSTDSDGWWDRRVWPVRRAVLATLDAARSRPELHHHDVNGVTLWFGPDGKVVGGPEDD